MERKTSTLNINSLLHKKQSQQRPPQPIWDDDDIGVLNLQDEDDEYIPEPEPKRRFKKTKQRNEHYQERTPRMINGLTIGQFIKEFFKMIGVLIPFGLGITYSLLQIFGNTPSIEQLKFLHVTQVMMFVMLLFVYISCKR